MTENKNKKEDFINEKKIISELEKNKDFENIQQELDRGNNFIDYFLVIGLEPEIYKKNWLYTEEFDILATKHKDDIKPKIISSFPPFEKTTISFDESILNHCFPNGYQLLKSVYKPKPKVFSFILDNNFFNINYPQKYLSCLICYENISQYKILSEMEKMKDNNIKNIDEGNIISSLKDPDIYIPKCLLVMSLYPFFGELEKIITEIYNYCMNQIIQLVDIIDNSSKNKKKQMKRMSTVKEIMAKNKDVNDPIEKIIENLTIELPVPPQGISTVKYFLNEEARTIKQNEMNKLPLVDINLKRICIDFEAKDIITIYNYLFLETRILFFSKNIEYLNSYIYGLLALLYPFQYQYQIITILPQENFEILESITPFIAGINQSYEEDFFEKNNFAISDCFFVVDIDKKKYLLLGEENKIPEFPKNYRKTLEKKLQDLINKSLKEERKLKTYFTKHKNLRNSSIMISGKMTMTNQSIVLNPNESIDTRMTSTLSSSKDMINSSQTLSDDINIDEDIDEDEEITGMLSNLNIDFEFNQEFNEIFFNFNANLLANYNQFLNRDFYSSNTAPSLDVLFKVTDFLKKIPQSEKNFYDKFITETQIFGDFLYLRMIPKNTKEKIRILLFEEKINQNSKGITNVFTTTKEYQFVDNHEIQRPRTLTKKEIDFYKDIKNEKKLINYGIVVSADKNDPNKVIFSYPIFPKLTNLLFFKDNMGVYFPPESWSENINSINEDLISKSHLGDVSIRLDDMKKYIYLCWMQMWALTFWYCEENEKRYWFQELVRIIEVSSCYEMEIFNLLFEALNKYGKENMVLKLYDILLKKKLNPSFKVHNIVMKIMENKKTSRKMNENLKKIIKKDEKIKYKKVNFSKRTFRSKYYPNILTENINFYGFDTCIVCQKDINLEIISKNLKDMNRDLAWSTCPNPECKAPLLPKLTVQFGEEINKNGEMKTNTCNYDTVVLFSPYNLKNNYNTSFSRNVGVKLDVHELMMKYSPIFWNSLWYFKINKLDYDFMLPYYYRLQEIKPYKELKVSLVENGKNESDDEDDKEPFEINKFKINKNSFTIK